MKNRARSQLAVQGHKEEEGLDLDKGANRQGDIETLPRTNISIWIVTPDEAAFGLLAVALEDLDCKIEFFGSGRKAVELLEQVHPHLVVLDLPLPDVGCAQVCEAFAAHMASPECHILSLAADPGPAGRFRLLSHGADEVLSKPFDGLELLLRLRSRVRRIEARCQQDRNFLTVGDVTLDLINQVALVDGLERRLTRSEFAVLRYLLEHEGRAVDTETLLVEALGYPAGLGNPDAIRTHIRNLREKIESDPSEPRRLINIPRLGYLVRGQAQGTERGAEPPRRGDACATAALPADRPEFSVLSSTSTEWLAHVGQTRGGRLGGLSVVG